MATQPWYITYHHYNTLKEVFNYEPTEKYDVLSANELMKDIRTSIKKELNLRDTFYELKKLVLRGQCFYSHGPETCCKYINYWLNKTVRDSEYGVNKDNFKMFEDFMRVDPKIKGSSVNCMSKLSYINNDAFEKMKKLYDLYDYFTIFKEDEDRSTLCRNISFLAKRYDRIMQEYEGKDTKLCNMLTNLKEVIETDRLVAKNICTKNTFDSFILRRHPPPPKEQNPPKNVQVPVQSRNFGKAHTRPTISASSPQAHGRHPGEIPTPAPVTVSSSSALGRNSRETATLPPLTVTSSPPQVLAKQARVGREETSSVPLARFPLPVPVPVLLSEPLESPETEETGEYGRPKGLQEQEQPQVQLQEEDHVHRLKDDVYHLSEDEEYTSLQERNPSAGSMQSTFDTGTIMGTIKDAVSNVLEAVEPVPILGVSGGMGALYLLLKYTPIGSLFGRNRRNNQNIPNFFDPEYGEQFSGYYPQYYNEDFPNYRMNIAYHPSSDELD
ncbi:PIR protein [Plasmodium vivax]|nr:PIR protein [Plasmodium vivax]